MALNADKYASHIGNLQRSKLRETHWNIFLNTSTRENSMQFRAKPPFWQKSENNRFCDQAFQSSLCTMDLPIES